jgi:hypothetical protein
MRWLGILLIGASLKDFFDFGFYKILRGTAYEVDCYNGWRIAFTFLF